MAPRRVLILGGTLEAAELARRLDADPNFEPVTSLAGRTRDPAPLAGKVRIGGFGGADGLALYLTANEIDTLVDATHPFAVRISRNAVAAGEAAGVPRLRLERPPWPRVAGDNWIEATDVENAASYLSADGCQRVFLAIGRQELAPFGGHTDIWFLLRMIDRPSKPIPLARHEVILGRGPFDADAEAELLTSRSIDMVVSKNSGGDAAYGKIAAARRLGLPVIMINRPAGLGGEHAGTVEAALNWLANGECAPQTT